MGSMGTGRARERGNAVLWIFLSIAVSAGIGFGVYVLVKNSRAAAADAGDTPTVTRPPEPEPKSPEEPIAPSTPTTTDPLLSGAPPPPADKARNEAVDPTLDDSTAVNTVMIGTPGVDGGLEVAAIVAGVKSATPKLQKCVDERTRAGAAQKIVVRVSLFFNRRGGVNDVSSDGEEEPALRACFEAALRGVRVGKTSDGELARVVVPLGFRPAPPADSACDEVSCVLSNYEPVCCAKFKKPSGAASGPRESLTRQDFATGITAVKDKVARCAADEGFIGTIKVRIKVDPSGSVATVAVSGTEDTTGVGTCVARVVKGAKFPETASGGSASYPFVIAE